MFEVRVLRRIIGLTDDVAGTGGDCKMRSFVTCCVYHIFGW